MKKLPLLLLSLFFLNSPAVLAVHFANFEVVDISLGDSLLEFMSEDEILDGIEKYKDLNRYSYLNEPNKFLEIIVPREKIYMIKPQFLLRILYQTTIRYMLSEVIRIT